MNSPEPITDATDLAGKVVIVTGSASGIGKATVEQLHMAGASPVLADPRIEVLTSIGDKLAGALVVEVDVTDDAQVADLIRQTLDRYGRIDGLVNNAGLSLHFPVEQVDLIEFSHVLQVNVVGMTRMMQAVIPVMREQGFGRIVNVSSGTTRMVPLGAGPYAATKSAMNMLSAVAGQELAADGITVSIVLPSITATEFADSRYKLGEESWPGLVTHSADYPARAIVRALRTGEAEIVVPHGPEDPDVFNL